MKVSPSPPWATMTSVARSFTRGAPGDQLLFLANLPHQREVQRIRVPDTLAKLGDCAAERGAHEEAEALLLEALAEFDAVHGPGRRDQAWIRRKLVGLYERWGETEKAAEARALLPGGS